MFELFTNALVAVKSAHRSVLERARSERGATMVEYALLVGLIAVVAVIAVVALGQGINGLFSSTNSCVGNLPSMTTC